MNAQSPGRRIFGHPGWQALAALATVGAVVVAIVALPNNDTQPTPVPTPTATEQPSTPSTQTPTPGPTPTTDPELLPPTASEQDQAFQTAEQIVDSYFQAVRRQDVEALVALASLPFFEDNPPILTSAAEVRTSFSWVLDPRQQATGLVTITTTTDTISNLVNRGEIIESGDRILANMQVFGDDIGVIAVVSQAGSSDSIVFVFRRDGAAVEWAGAWG